MNDGEAVIALHDNLDYLTRLAIHLLEGCRIEADDGTILFTPDTSGHYRALWTRDWAYMVEYAGDLMTNDQVEACIACILRAQRDDGAIPDRVRADGVAVYVAGPEDRPMGKPNLDNAPFLVIAIDEYLLRVAESRRAERLRSWLPQLDRGLAYIPRSRHGLVLNDPLQPHSPYGFTDTVGKTGELFMESLLYWTACRRLSNWYDRLDDVTRAAHYRQQATLVEENISILWDDQHGAFRAATHDCQQIDLWANAYAVYLDFPLGERREQISAFLARNYDRFVWHGQVRHLLRGEYWQRLLTDVPPDTYQNGGYWATAAGWVYWTLAQAKPELAQRMLADLIADFQQGGACEWVTETRRALPGYVASVVNTRAAIMRQFA